MSQYNSWYRTYFDVFTAEWCFRFLKVLFQCESLWTHLMHDRIFRIQIKSIGDVCTYGWGKHFNPQYRDVFQHDKLASFSCLKRLIKTIQKIIYIYVRNIHNQWNSWRFARIYWRFARSAKIKEHNCSEKVTTYNANGKPNQPKKVISLIMSNNDYSHKCMFRFLIKTAIKPLICLTYPLVGLFARLLGTWFFFSLFSLRFTAHWA